MTFLRSKIGKWIALVANIGVRSSMSPIHAKQIKATNLLAATIAALIFPYIFVFYFIGSLALAIGIVPVFCAYLVVIYLNHLGKWFVPARILLIVAANLVVAIYALALGKSADVHLFFFVLICYPFVLFSIRELYLMLSSALFCFANLMFILVFGYESIPLVEVSAELTMLFSYSLYVATAFGIISTVFYFRLASDDSDKNITWALNSERKKSEHLRAIIESAQDYIYVIDRDYCFLEVNKFDKDKFGDKNNILGKNVFEVMGEERGNHWAKVYEKIFKEHDSQRFEDSEITMDGEEFWHSTVLSPTFDYRGQVTSIVGVTRDISQMKKSERKLQDALLQAESANQAKSAFLATMSHEIRTPIGIVVGYAQQLAAKRMNSEEHDHAVDAISRNGDHLMNLIDEILDLSKIESGQLHVEPVPVYCKKEIEGVVSLLKGNAQRKGIDLNCQFTGDLPEVIYTDPLRLRQALVNLITNAIKFTHTGSIDVKTRIHKSENTGENELIIDIIDTGIGISKAGQEQLFKAFSQAKPYQAENQQGTGLGLYLTKKLSVALGGHLQLVWSQQGKGSHFRLVIDPGDSLIINFLDKKQVALAPSVSEESFEEHIDALSGINILVVEDNLDNQGLFRKILEMAGAQVTIVGDGEVAVEAAKESQYHLIIMDIQLPVMDGYEATRKIREEGFKGPIVAVTAYAMQEEKMHCMEAGCTAYLSKPIRMSVLISTIKKWI